LLIKCRLKNRHVVLVHNLGKGNYMKDTEKFDNIEISENANKTENPESEHAVDTDRLLRQLEAESNIRDAKGITSWIITVLAASMSLFHLYMAGIGRMPSNQVRMIHLGFVMSLIFLLYPWRRKNDGTAATINVFDYGLAILGFATNIYLFIFTDAISVRGGVMSTTDNIVGAITILLVLEAARRCVGKELSILAIVFLLYARFGRFLPGVLMHRGFSTKRLISHMNISAEGIYGIPLGTSATIIFLFILFGAFLSETGLSEFFTRIATAAAGDKPGGPAKVAILASGFLGMINGSAAANVVTTGAFTIPLMKKMGYKPHFAGAVEAVASTGGQIMPPVMGAAAFIMAEYLGVPYRTIIFAAAIPAVLYYVALWAFVDIEARRSGLKGVPKDELPNPIEELKHNGHLIIPVILLIGMLLMNYTPPYSAFYSILLLVAVSFFKKHSRLRPIKLLNALESGAKQGLSVAIACAVVGLVVGVITLTGIGLQLANIILFASGGLLIPTMILTMVACFVLGMGMPTSAAYIVAATVATPAMSKLGVAPLTTHMFVFYYAVLSAITPPVALASYAGAGIANAPPGKVGWTAVRLGLTGFIVPFMFVFSPELLMEGNPWFIPWVCFTAYMGCTCLAASLQGFYRVPNKIYESVALFACALLLIDSKPITDAIGLGIFITIWLLQKNRAKSQIAA
jgi:TRAP transporter 4TM/12TM fusion protein